MTDTTTTRPEEGLDTRPPPPRPPGFGVVSQLRWAWRQLTSMRTALVLLFLLALGAVPGSVVPQRAIDPARVAQFYTDHPTLAPLLDKLSAFDVFAAPWFAAIYLLLFISLAGCVLPRSWLHVRAMRARPPAAPRNLGRLPHARRWEVDTPPEDALAAARSLLARERFRVDAETGAVAAEKGYLRETGNLVFHLSLLSLLFAVAAGALFGYKGTVMVTEGDGFANTVSAYDVFKPGRVFQPGQMQPFTVHLDDFHASYVTDGPQRGQAKTFDARVHYRPDPSSPERSRVISVNHPLEVDGAKVYLLGHGYAPTFLVKDGKGQVAFKGAVPFVPQDTATFTSDGVVKVPDAQPKQIGLAGFFTPTTVPSPQGPTSIFPAAQNPAVTLLAYSGDLGLDSGQPQSVFKLDTSRLTPLKSQLLTPGETMKLPNDLGSVTFTGYREWATIQVTDDPGKLWALVSAGLAVIGLLLSLGVRRRRVWVRAGGEEGGRTVVEVGGLSRADAAGRFDEEFASLADTMRRRSARPGGPGPSTSGMSGTSDTSDNEERA